MIGEMGWTYPMQMTIRDLIQITAILNPDTLDQDFIEFYTFNAGEMMIELRSGLLASEHLDVWRPLIQQCIDAYERGGCSACQAYYRFLRVRSQKNMANG